VGNAQLLELPMQTVTKGARLVTTVNLLGQRRLFLGPLQKLGWAKSLRRLGRTAIDLAHHHVAIQMHVDAQLDDLVGWRPAGAARGRCPCGERYLAGAQHGLDQRFGFWLHEGQGLLLRRLDSIFALVSLFYHRGSDCGIPPSLTTPCYLSDEILGHSASISTVQPPLARQYML